MQMQKKMCKRPMLQRLKPLLSLGAMALVSQSNLLPAHADTVGPAFSNTNPSPSWPGASVYSLKYAEAGNYVFGSLTDSDGINRVDVFIRRYSDGAYWNGSNWQYPSAVVPTDLIRDSTNTFLNYYAFNGPPAAAIIAGQQYLVVVKAADNLGNVSSYSVTVNGID